MVPQNTLVDVEKKPHSSKFRKILRAVFNLTPKQYEVFNQVREIQEGTCILNIVGLLNSERSIIQKYMKALSKKGLVSRRSVTLSEFTQRCQRIDREDMIPQSTKGYLYLYSAISDEELLEKIQTRTKNWIETVKEYCNL